MSEMALLLAGLILGALYFGGLWITLRRLPRWRRPFLSIALSWLIRLEILLGGGAWFLQHPLAPPLPTLLLLSCGVWLSRTLLITSLLASVERSLPVSN